MAPDEMQPELTRDTLARIGYVRPMGVQQAECDHMDIIVHRAIGDSFSDNEVIYGQCRICHAWVVSTLMFGGGGHVETRLMLPAERERYDPSMRSNGGGLVA